MDMRKLLANSAVRLHRKSPPIILFFFRIIATIIVSISFINFLHILHLPYIINTIIRGICVLFAAYTIIKNVIVFLAFGDHRKNIEELKLLRDRENMEDRNNFTTRLTMIYYDVVTDWYELGWGNSFQLASSQGFKDESFKERLIRADHSFAYHAGIKKGQLWLDMGCGIGGPMRNIVKFTEAKVIGVNNNGYQVSKVHYYNHRAGLSELASVKVMDFHDIDSEFPNDHFDGVYALEAICHANKKTELFKKVYKILKPGGHVCLKDWVLLPAYCADNDEHRAIKLAIEIFGGVEKLINLDEYLDAIKNSGLEIVEAYDTVDSPNIHTKWYEVFDPSSSSGNIMVSMPAIRVTQWIMRLMEFIKLIPSGTAATHRRISYQIPHVRRSGELKLFSPQYFFKAIKPTK